MPEQDKNSTWVRLPDRPKPRVKPVSKSVGAPLPPYSGEPISSRSSSIGAPIQPEFDHILSSTEPQQNQDLEDIIQGKGLEVVQRIGWKAYRDYLETLTWTQLADSQ